MDGNQRKSTPIIAQMRGQSGLQCRTDRDRGDVAPASVRVFVGDHRQSIKASQIAKMEAEKIDVAIAGQIEAEMRQLPVLAQARSDAYEAENRKRTMCEFDARRAG